MKLASDAIFDVTRAKVISGFWLDRGGYWGAVISIDGESIEINFEGGDFIWNHDRKPRLTFKSKSTGEINVVLAVNVVGCEKLIRELSFASAEDDASAFADAFK